MWAREIIQVVSRSMSSKAFGLSRQNVWILDASLASHQEPQLFHALCALSWLGSALRLTFVFLAMFLVEFLPAALTLLLKTLDDINGTSHVAVIITTINGIAIGGFYTRGTILTTERIRRAGK
jgi:hypothetical protein